MQLSSQVPYVLHPSPINTSRTSLEVQWLRLHASTTGASVLPLAGELRSHMPNGKKKTQKTINTSKLCGNVEWKPYQVIDKVFWCVDGLNTHAHICIFICVCVCLYMYIPIGRQADINLGPISVSLSPFLAFSFLFPPSGLTLCLCFSFPVCLPVGSSFLCMSLHGAQCISVSHRLSALLSSSLCLPPLLTFAFGSGCAAAPAAMMHFLLMA